MKMNEQEQHNQDYATIEWRKNKLAELVSNEEDSTEYIAYHATTIESIERLITYGSIPGFTEESNKNPNLPQKGDIYFLPNPQSFPYETLPNLWKVDNPNQNALQKFAQHRAIGHRFCSVLGIDIAEYTMYAENLVEHPSDIDFKIAEDAFNKLHFTPQAIEHAKTLSLKRKGIILGLNGSALSKYPISVGDGGEDFRLSTKEKGLEISDIAFVMPLGEEERIYLESLQEFNTSK